MLAGKYYQTSLPENRLVHGLHVAARGVGAPHILGAGRPREVEIDPEVDLGVVTFQRGLERLVLRFPLGRDDEDEPGVGGRSGVGIHDDGKGRVTDANIVPPTAQNQAVMERDLRQLVSTRGDMSTAALTALCEHAIRNYDPCISCATHFLTLRVEGE